MRRNYRKVSSREKGVIAVLVVIVLPVIVGFAALTVDVGVMYNARSDLQTVADATALATAAALADYSGGNLISSARTVADTYVSLNKVLGRTVQLDASDVEFGRASYNATTGKYDFTVNNVIPDSVRVTVRMTNDSSNGPLDLYFASVIGISSAEISASAIAKMVPRDIAIVADLSGSQNDDSELRHLGVTEINIFDVWANIPPTYGVNGIGDGINATPQGDPANPIAPPAIGPSTQGNVPSDAAAAAGNGQVGPTWGWMYYWGNDVNAQNYDPRTDPGLIDLPRYSSWNDANLDTWLADIGYSANEIAALNSPAFDGNKDAQGQYAWTNRVAVALGLARWDSGIPGGLWESVPPADRNIGDSDNWPGSSELTYLVQYPFESGSWRDYIYNYIRKSNSRMAVANSDFQYKFGPKTLVNYLLERKPRNSQTSALANTPAQPLQAVKDAAGYMVWLLDSLQTNDQLSLEVYATTASHEVDLTNDFPVVGDRLSAMQAGYYNTLTNMGNGIDAAITELTSTRGRNISKKVIILLTDGKANVDSSGSYSISGGAAHALAQAQVAASLGIQVFTISVGVDADQVLMSSIADIGDGDHYHAEGTIDQYSAQLEQIFQALGGKRPVELVQ